MKIIVARSAGFCFGVHRAIKSVYQHLNQSSVIHTLGPIIHNRLVVEELKKKGVLVSERVEDISDGTVVIRSHGVGQDVYRKIKEKGLKLVDATCPYVKRIHHLVEDFYKNGYNIIIIGEKEHPEVIGINGWCDNKAYILNDTKDIDNLPQMSKACVVAQTTITQQKWDEIIKGLQNKVDQLEVFNTICHTTFEHQKEAESIAKTVDVMWVIGGKNSSNTKKLYSICKAHCKKTFAIETAKDINANVIGPGDVVGITAGASTPDWIIKEVVEKMNEFVEQKNDNELLEEKVTPNTDETEDSAGVEEPDTGSVENENAEQQPNDNENNDGNVPESTEEAKDEEPLTMENFEDKMVRLRPGKIVKGTVLSVSESEVIVNIGYKADGILPASEASVEDDIKLQDMFKPGDEIEVEVKRTKDDDGNVQLSRKSVEQRKRWKEIEDGFKSGKEFEGECVEVVKGGVIARINGIRAFVPASHLSTHYVEDLNVFLGKPLRLRIIEVEKGRRRVVASQRAILEEEEEKKRQALWDSIQEGQRITGVVRRLTDFGAFVDIGGVDGLIHISDLSWGHIGHPSEAVKEGQQVEVVILGVDRERERISLGYKQTLPHPWDNIEEKYPVGSTVTGKVVRITSFGAFIELEPGVDGLVHISQVADKRIAKVEDVLEVGQEVQVKVLDVNPDDRRISLSIREALPKEEKPKDNVSDDNTDSKFKKEEMTVPLGEFFPEGLSDENRE